MRLRAPRVSLGMDALRTQLIRILDWEKPTSVSTRPSPEFRRQRAVLPPGFDHSAWDLVEHLRIAQADILDFCLNAKYSHDPHGLGTTGPRRSRRMTRHDREPEGFARDDEAAHAGAADLTALRQPASRTRPTCAILLLTDHNVSRVNHLRPPRTRHLAIAATGSAARLLQAGLDLGRGQDPRENPASRSRTNRSGVPWMCMPSGSPRRILAVGGSAASPCPFRRDQPAAR